MPWLLEKSVLETMASSAQNVTAEQCRDYEARVAAQNGTGEKVSRVMSKKGGVARINIAGVMTDKPDFLAFLFGGGNTTYADIIDAIQLAESDDEVEAIELSVDSPGGNIDGMFAAMDAIKNTTKPVTAVVLNKAASAAFGLVSQADRILAANDATRFGSIGVVAEIRTQNSSVTITSTNAPDKRPDVKTEEGKATIRAELDGIADLFAERIAQGRDVSVEKVNADFGRGGMLMANDALKRGMIDAVEGVESAENSNPAALSGHKPEATMDLNKLKAEHPDVYAAAVEIGTEQERDRVCAHLELGKAYNAMDTAIEAVTEGKGMTALITAKYVAAGANNAAVQDRQGESDNSDPGAPPEGDAETETEAKDKAASDAILAHAAELAGVELNGGA